MNASFPLGNLARNICQESKFCDISKPQCSPTPPCCHLLHRLHDDLASSHSLKSHKLHCGRHAFKTYILTALNKSLTQSDGTSILPHIASCRLIDLHIGDDDCNEARPSNSRKDLRDESRRVQDALDGLSGDVSEVMPVG
jgi:hypothetical protein